MSTQASNYSTAPITNLLASFRLFKNNPATHSTELNGLFRYRSEFPHPWFSGVIVSRPPSGDESATIKEQLDYFRNNSVATFTWWLEPGISIEEWGVHLQPHGFRISHEPPGMACHLSDLPAFVPVPANFTIKTANDLPQFEIWANTFAASFGFPTVYVQPFYNLMAGFGFQGIMRHYIGYLDQEPVAVASILYSDGVAGIYSVGVRQSARRQGLGAAMTLAPLLEARELGYSLGILQSSEMGFNVYQRLGFRKVCDVTHYYFHAASDD